MNLMCERHTQIDDQHDDEHNDSHLPTSDQNEKEDPEENNAISKCNRKEDIDHQSKLETSALRVAQEIQVMKDKMDMMMNAMRGRVATNLEELDHRTNSLFTVTSCPLPPKFWMLQVKTYEGLKDPLDHLKSFKTLMHL